MIKIVPFFSNDCPTDISSTLLENHKNFFRFILNKIYKLAELPSLIDLQEYILVIT